ncbi:MAG: D-methionine transport system ATP-binding protein [Bacillota bacterium]|nr:D-methionine transport system ATP-binding protein [Bacillota bacterium]MDK2855690.1 D-methionine transport system ATP-binding protein [Bacillota bacterium]MDK2924914.1 D-methionine transport system ATP-binding protein [Bacillota bacterium]
MVEVKHLTKVYTTPAGKVTALADVSFSVERGEIFGVMGLSGAGKSTLIRCLNFLERPTSGEVWIEGKNLATLDRRELARARQGIGMIFQHFNLLKLRTVAQNVAFPLEIVGERPEAIRARVRELLDLVGLADKANAYPHQLSGGQKQRVGIARALACRPRLLLSDEATSALDPETTQSILALLKEINRSLGVTIILITHELAVIRAVCDRVAVLEGGRLVEVGPVAEVFSRPRALATRRLIAISGLTPARPELASDVVGVV